MAYDTNTARRANQARGTETVSTGIPFWDMMLSLGKASSQALTAYAPQAEYGARAGRGAPRAGGDVEVIPVGEETLNVGTRAVAGETTRVRRVVVETPVEREVTLREERVVVERRKPAASAAVAPQGVLTEAAVEMGDSYEVVEVWKSVRVTEEVVLRREVTERRETVRDTVRRDEVVVEQVRPALPAPRRAAEAAPRPAAVPDAAKLEADLKRVAERFEADAPKPGPKPAAQPQAEAPKAAAEPSKAPVPSVPARPVASAAQDDKAGQARKG